MAKLSEQYDIASIMENCAIPIDEVFDDMRKGVPQTFYVVLIPPIAEEWDEDVESMVTIQVPKEIQGYWRMEHATDLRYTTLREAYRNDSWSPCEKVETVTYEYRIKY